MSLMDNKTEVLDLKYLENKQAKLQQLNLVTMFVKKYNPLWTFDNYYMLLTFLASLNTKDFDTNRCRCFINNVGIHKKNLYNPQIIKEI